MPQVIDIPGVGAVEFPDGMDDAAIEAAAAKLHQEAQPQKSLGGLVSNAMGEVAAAPGALMDMVTSAPQAAWTLLKASGYRGGGAGSPNLEAAQQVGDVAKAIPGVYAEKYGSPQKALDTAYQAPLSTLMDVSALAGGAGGALRAAGSAAKVPGLVRAGAAVGRAGELVDPVRGAASAVATAGNLVRPSTATLQNAGTRMMQSAMKVAKPVQDSNTFNVARVAARDRIMPTEAGFRQAAENAKNYKQQAIAIARDADQRGSRLSPTRIVGQMDRKIAAMPANEIAPRGHVGPLAKLRDEVWQAHSTPVMEPIPGTGDFATKQPVLRESGQRIEVPIKVRRSMKFTENMNERQNFAKKGALSMSPSESPAVKAEDTLRKIVRAERERVAPGMNAANEARGEQIAVMKQLQNYTLRREGNMDVIPARALLGGGMAAGLAAGGAPVGAVAGGTLVPWIVNSPAFKGKQAIRLYHGDKVLEGAGRDLRRAATATSRAGVASDAIREALLQAMAGERP